MTGCQGLEVGWPTSCYCSPAKGRTVRPGPVRPEHQGQTYNLTKWGSLMHCSEGGHILGTPNQGKESEDSGKVGSV